MPTNAHRLGIRTRSRGAFNGGRTTLLVVTAGALLAAGCGAGARAPASTSFPGTTSTSTTTVPATVPTATPSTTLPASPTTRLPDEPAPLPLAGRIVVIDPGHNGQNAAHLDEINRLVDIGNGTKPCNTTGTAAAGGATEAQLNWDVGVRVRDVLHDLGADVVLTRTDNVGWGPCITERAAVGNRVEADAVISIHADGGPVDGRGFHVIYPAMIPGLTDDIAAPSLRLAELLLDAMAETAMPIADYTAVDGLSERSDLGGLNLSDVPVVFLEMGNMKSPEDAELLALASFQDDVAAAIATAVSAFLEDP